MIDFSTIKQAVLHTGAEELREQLAIANEQVAFLNKVAAEYKEKLETRTRELAEAGGVWERVGFLEEKLKHAETSYDRLTNEYLPKYQAAIAELTSTKEKLAEAVGIIGWYGEQARLCRLIHSEGDSGRHALSGDGGKRAQAFLAKQESSHD